MKPGIGKVLPFQRIRTQEEKDIEDCLLLQQRVAFLMKSRGHKDDDVLSYAERILDLTYELLDQNRLNEAVDFTRRVLDCLEGLEAFGNDLVERKKERS